MSNPIDLQEGLLDEQRTQRTTEDRFVAGAKDFAAFIRDHWGIENGLHWLIDTWPFAMPKPDTHKKRPRQLRNHQTRR